MPPPSKADESVRVMVRIRPMSSKEKQDGRLEVTVASFERAEVTITNPAAATSEAPKAFTFDAAFGSKSTQQQVYDTAATAIVEAVMDGYNGTIFAYGQTGAGKSHTMEGLPDPPEMRGIIPNSFKHIFDKVAITKKKQILVRASYLEIYNEEIRDLLSKDPKAGLDLKENADSGVFVKGLTAQVVKDAAEIDAVMRQGNKNRSVGATNMNQTSSRSHSIFTIVVECLSDGMDGKDHVCVGKLNLVDLAGSERQSKTGATGDRLQEANKINLSLSALGNVISALVDGKSKHIPYRDSKLTRLLQDSLGGNTKTVMIANCGPADYNYEETLTTLRYASRAKQIKNKPKINEDPKDAMIREFQEEIEALKAKLAAISSGAPSTVLVDGQAVPANAAPVEIVEVEKVVEKVIIEKGISEEEAKRIAEKAKQEIGAVRKKAQDELSAAAKDNALAEHQKREMELKLENERKQHEEMEKQQKALVLKLQSMEAKLLVGSEILNKAAQQEDELRKKKLELEERKRQELKLARELAEREENNLMKEEQYQSLQEEAEAKTKKLKKVFNKVKEVLADIKQMEKAHAREREDLLDTIRELTASLKLKSLVLEYFMPREAATLLESAATWDDEEDNFRLPHLELSGNSLRPRQRPASASGLRRPETASEKSRKKYVSEDEVPEMEIQIERNQYLVYTSDEEGDGYALAEDKIITNPPPAKDRPKTSKKSSRKTKDASIHDVFLVGCGRFIFRFQILAPFLNLRRREQVDEKMELPAIAPRKGRMLLHRNASMPVFDFSEIKEGKESKDTDSIYQKRVKETTLRRISMGTWARMPKVAHRMPTFDMEERLLANPTNVRFVVDVGIRYAEHTTSKAYAVLLLEKAGVMSEEPGGFRYWQVLGHLHYHLMQRYRRFHPCFIFHLQQATQTFKKALTYTENRSDVLMLIHYAFAMFMEGVKERPYEMLQTINLRHGIQFGKTENQIYIDRLFMHFQVCAANEKLHEAVVLLRKVTTLPPTGFSTMNVELMLARCLQIQGDFLASTEIFSRILSTKFGIATNYTDESYVTLWHELADVCLKYGLLIAIPKPLISMLGHLYLAIEYLTLALTYAKQAKIRATLYYERGRAHYCLGDINAAEDDYRRGRNSNHEIKPKISLADFKKSYKSEFCILVAKPISEMIASVRKGMGKTTASLKLQRSFRQYLEKKRGAEDPHQLTRRLLLAKQKTAKTIDISQASTMKMETANKEAAIDNSVKEKEDSAAQRLDVLASLQLLHTSNIQLKPYLPHAHPRQYKPLKHLPKAVSVNFLTPDYDRPDHRRQRSLTSYRRLGYSNGDITYIQHWRALLKVGLKLFATSSALSRSIVHVKTFHPKIPEDIAICALVDSDGKVDEACGKLSDSKYYMELQSVVEIIDVESMCSAQWSSMSSIPKDHVRHEDYEDSLRGVPEVDPATGRFLVQNIRDVLSPSKAVKDQSTMLSTKNKNDSSKLGSPELKRASYRTAHIINDQVAQDSSTREILSLLSLK